MRPAWIEISLTAIKRNISAFRRIISGEAEIMGIIKADAYGHGALEVANALREEGVKRFGVALVQEGVELRENGADEPLLILGYTPEEDFRLALEYGLTLTIYNHAQAVVLNSIAGKTEKSAPLHLKVDTGMGRIGFLPGKAAVEEIEKITTLPFLTLEGIYSHQAWADNLQSNFAEIQFTRFQDFLSTLDKRGIHIPIRHLANSAATINFPSMHLDLVRIGISLYGLYPDAEMAVNPKIELHPAMQVKAKLVHVKRVPAGTPLSYGCTFTTGRKSLIGTVPMGYADGIPRALSNNGQVLVRGTRCPIAGRICMDQFMVDLTDLGEGAVGDEVVFLGRQGAQEISADEIAERAGTISYEIVTRMSRRLPRKYLDS